jgi:hypothetical protein
VGHLRPRRTRRGPRHLLRPRQRPSRAHPALCLRRRTRRPISTSPRGGPAPLFLIFSTGQRPRAAPSSTSPRRPVPAFPHPGARAGRGPDAATGPASIPARGRTEAPTRQPAPHPSRCVGGQCLGTEAGFVSTPARGQAAAPMRRPASPPHPRADDTRRDGPPHLHLGATGGAAAPIATTSAQPARGAPTRGLAPPPRRLQHATPDRASPSPPQRTVPSGRLRHLDFDRRNSTSSSARDARPEHRPYLRDRGSWRPDERTTTFRRATPRGRCVSCFFLQD